MDITTKFKSGDEVFTIDPKTMKAKKFKVYAVSTYSADNKASVSLHEDDSVYCNSYDEDKCFATEDELKAYVFGK